MKNVLAASVSILILSISIFAQNEANPCPTILITAPAGVTSSGESMTFFVKVQDIKENHKLNFVWTVSAGVIIEGQNTSIIRVATTLEMVDVKVTAKVKVEGLPENCVDTASEWAAIVLQICDVETDNYGKIPLKQEFARFDILITQLQNNSNSKGFVHISVQDNETVVQTKKRIKKLIKHIKYRRFPESRFIFAIEKSDSYSTRIQIIPGNVEFPECENCEIIKGEDVK